MLNADDSLVAVLQRLDRSVATIASHQGGTRWESWLTFGAMVVTLVAVSVAYLALQRQREDALRRDLSRLNQLQADYPEFYWERRSHQGEAPPVGKDSALFVYAARADAYRYLALNLFERCYLQWRTWPESLFSGGRARAWDAYVADALGDQPALLELLRQPGVRGQFDPRFVDFAGRCGNGPSHARAAQGVRDAD